jgi:hypothetical protein
MRSERVGAGNPIGDRAVRRGSGATLAPETTGDRSGVSRTSAYASLCVVRRDLVFARARVTNREVRRKVGAAPERQESNGLSRSGGSWSSASSAIACKGTARLLSRVFGCFTRPFAYARRTWTTQAARFTSPYSSANSSEGRSPVAAANTTIAPKVDLSRSATERICAPESKGCCSRAAPTGIRHPALGRVLFDQLPRDRPIQHLPQRLRRLEAMPLRNS